MTEKAFREKLARLHTLIAIKDAQLMANPKPYLEDMSRRCVELLNVLEQVEYALSPELVYDTWENGFKNVIPNPIDIQGEALLRCNAALDIIKDYKR